MDKNQFNNPKIANWEYLPDTDILVGYLRKTLVELSKCCKRYRNQFEREVLKSLDLETWFNNNREKYNEESWEFKKALEFLKTDLGSKLKFVKKFTLDWHIDCNFAEIFVKLLPNIKSLVINLDYNNEDYLFETRLGLIAILNSLKRLENLVLIYAYQTFEHYIANSQVFPKSLKSFSTSDYEVSYETKDYIHIYETIDTSYTNLHSIRIVSNRMLQNLNSEMQNLQEVEIYQNEMLDTSKLVAFLKANPQLKKLNTSFEHCNEEIIITVLSSKYLEHWHISNWNWNGIEVNELPFNYSIKHLGTNSYMPTSIALKIINTCKRLETLDLKYYVNRNSLDFSKFERKINKLLYGHFTLDSIVEIDSSRLFNQVHLDSCSAVKTFIEGGNIDKLKNYRFKRLVSGYGILKHINNTN